MDKNNFVVRITNTKHARQCIAILKSLDENVGKDIVKENGMLYFNNQYKNWYIAKRDLTNVIEVSIKELAKFIINGFPEMGTNEPSPVRLSEIWLHQETNIPAQVLHNDVYLWLTKFKQSVFMGDDIFVTPHECVRITGKEIEEIYAAYKSLQS